MENVEPLYVRVHQRTTSPSSSNPEGLPAGTSFPADLTLREGIPQAHKVALRDLAPGDAIVRYGEVIGHARARHRPGLVGAGGDGVAAAPPRARRTAAGHRRPGAAAAARRLHIRGLPQPRRHASARSNLLGITTTVQCVAPTVEYARRGASRRRSCRAIPNVDDVVAITHTYGCGVAIDAPGAAIPIRTLRNIGLHPNLGGEPLVVSLGCEKLQPARLFAGRARRRSALQDAGAPRLRAKWWPPSCARRKSAWRSLNRRRRAHLPGVATWSSGCNAAAATRSPA